jgi:dTDP-4-amino-4,6-dideoxygalactose transaminase
VKIPIAKIGFTAKDLNNVLKTLRSGWIVQGAFVREFERKWMDFTGVRRAVAVTSCTSALNLSLKALGIGHGDEVIVPSFTWIATANAAEVLGARVVFCDIDLDTFNINPDLIGRLITRKTRAIVPVHLFGLAADMTPIIRLARKHRLHVVEDAACGFGSYYHGRHVGNFGICGCFSFHPRKALTTGEGGMVTTNDTRFAKILCAMRDHGATLSDWQRHAGPKPYLLPDFPHAGFNYRLTDIQASLGSSQMDRARQILDRRIRIAEKYNDFMDRVPWLKKPAAKKGYRHGYQSYVCLFKPDDFDLKRMGKINRQRNDFMDYLAKKGIATRPGTHAVHRQGFYAAKYRIDETAHPNSYIADRCSIAFPLYPSLKNAELQYIFSAISRYRIR